MVSRKKTFSTLVLTTCLLIFPSLTFAREASRIELKDSTVFENVTFKVDNEYKVITFQDADGKHNVSFADIAAIFDADGKDITINVLGKYYTPPGEGRRAIETFSLGAQQPGERKYPYSFGIHAQPNISVPVGDFYDGFTLGIGYGADVSFPVSRQIAVRGTVSRSGMKTDFDLPSGESFSVWRYILSAQYYKWPRWRTDGKLMYYLYSGIGGISHRLSTGGTSEDISTKLVTVVGFGLVTQVSKTIGVEVGGEFDVIYVGIEDTGYSYYGNVRYAYIMDLRIGLVLLL